ncbi:sigma-70 family RNA polymerase sigma factor [Draconibacterium sp. IB214405]|uniref:RNA polymerase sigma factor n=1 Tax=Draconibacterium sp. IB214405 TaxID=3097352 RepID=UPI002A117C44|nr:sigma-70 family RNA polymerase sigma factor [Draconibacterium sp. IB214405]MDX8341175.1 sigma-70 family RNA polymerase sigma factor [Draconibacterium sp. IB214405]
MNINADKELWEDFLKGEDYALSHIYYQHVQGLYRYGKKFTNDDELIKDTIQDLFFDLIRTRKNLHGTDNIGFYLIASFRRKLATSIRKSNVFSDTTDEEYFQAEIVYSVEKELIEKEELTEREQLLQAGFNELAPKQREILYYRYICEFSYDQICEITSLKYDSARKQVFRALKSLRKAVEGKSSIVFFLSFYAKEILFPKKS